MMSLKDITAQLSTLKNLTEFTASPRLFIVEKRIRVTPLPSVRVLRFGDWRNIGGDQIPDVHLFVRSVARVFPQLERLLVRYRIPDQSVIIDVATRLGVELGTYSN